MKTFKNYQGFSLIQLIVGISIVLVLSAIVLFGEDAVSRRETAKDVQRAREVESIAKALELYQNDNGALPSDIASANQIYDGQKYVLCSSSATRTCAGQSNTCLLINDADFLKPYLGGSLPIDPGKTSTTDTGYYIARSGDQMIIGACESYGDAITYTVRAKVPTACGNGVVSDDEVCDDGNTVTEGCGVGIAQNNTAGTYCNSDCSAIVTVPWNMVCDYTAWTNDCEFSGVWWTTSDTTGTYCNPTCTVIEPSGQICTSGVGDDIGAF